MLYLGRKSKALSWIIMKWGIEINLHKKFPGGKNDRRLCDERFAVWEDTTFLVFMLLSRPYFLVWSKFSFSFFSWAKEVCPSAQNGLVSWVQFFPALLDPDCMSVCYQCFQCFTAKAPVRLKEEIVFCQICWPIALKPCLFLILKLLDWTELVCIFSWAEQNQNEWDG